MECFRCGKAAPKGGLVEGLCPDCFVETKQPLVIPEHIQVLVCGSCGSVLRGKTWGKPVEGDKITEFALQENTALRAPAELVSLQWAKGKGDERSFDVEVTAKLRVGGAEFERLLPTHMRIKQSVCDVCSRRSGSYFEAILQVRGFDAPLGPDHADKMRQFVEEAIDRAAAKERGVFLTKVEDVHGGFDFYVSSTTAAQQMASSLRDHWGATLTRSGKIAGVRDGAELQRHTFSIRLPKFIRGDVLVHNDRLYRLTKVHPHSVVVTDLETGAQESKADDWVKRATAPGSEAPVMDAVVVSVARDEIQVLDPTNYETVTLRNWARAEPGAQKAPVVRYRGRLFLLGAAA